MLAPQFLPETRHVAPHGFQDFLLDAPDVDAEEGLPGHFGDGVELGVGVELPCGVDHVVALGVHLPPFRVHSVDELCGGVDCVAAVLVGDASAVGVFPDASGAPAPDVASDALDDSHGGVTGCEDGALLYVELQEALDPPIREMGFLCDGLGIHSPVEEVFCEAAAVPDVDGGLELLGEESPEGGPAADVAPVVTLVPTAGLFRSAGYQDDVLGWRDPCVLDACEGCEAGYDPGGSIVVSSAGLGVEVGSSHECGGVSVGAGEADVGVMGDVCVDF